MPKVSVGLLMFRKDTGSVEVLLVHPGGPFWKNKDLGSWSVPKGVPGPDEDPFEAARREFTEETGFPASGVFIPLKRVRTGSKWLQTWAFEGECDATRATSNSFEMEWPPKSGRMQEFPEVDRAAWFEIGTAREKINQGQRPLLDDLERALQEWAPGS